jgi:hypothetical protein
LIIPAGMVKLDQVRWSRKLKIGVLGTGMVGNTIGTKLVALGHDAAEGRGNACHSPFNYLRQDLDAQLAFAHQTKFPRCNLSATEGEEIGSAQAGATFSLCQIGTF